MAVAVMNLWLWLQSFTEIWERIKGYVNYKFIFGKIEFTLSTLVQGVVVFLIAIFISRWLRSLFERRMAEKTRVDPGIRYTVMRLIHYFIITVGLLFALQISFALDLTSIAVVFTALSVGIGFGLQFIAGDLASGFILLFERPVRIGDFVTVTGPDSKLIEGRVQSINLRTTVIITNDNIAAIVPNHNLVNENLINWSYSGRRSRLAIPVGVSYDSDVDVVTKTLLRAAEDVQFVLEEPKPSVQFLEFADWSLNFRLLVWTDRPRRHPTIKSEINYRIRKLFLEEGIEIPFPQSELRVRRGSAIKVADDGDHLAQRNGPEEDEQEEAESR
ncbi:MAG TPA: mechanosensitive ion channel domain-containing protein [Pyrinomonadaceae bacterium]|nr:mechanosensitive ion channel domain-containing protein [Pyrinomonadaceae bacterium]